MQKNGSGDDRDVGQPNATPITDCKSKDIKVPFDRNILHNIAPDGWKCLGNLPENRKIIEDALDFLIFNTHVVGGVDYGGYDRKGLSTRDYIHALNCRQYLKANTHAGGVYLKTTVLMIYKYRKQLVHIGITYPEDLFGR